MVARCKLDAGSVATSEPVPALSTRKSFLYSEDVKPVLTRTKTIHSKGMLAPMPPKRQAVGAVVPHALERGGRGGNTSLIPHRAIPLTHDLHHSTAAQVTGGMWFGLLIIRVSFWRIAGGVYL